VHLDAGARRRKPSQVLETDEELAALDALLDRSFASAGSHLTGIIRPERRLTARELSAYLVGVRHFVVATTTASCEPRCSAVDTLFLHGHVWFSTSGTSLKARHLERRSALSAAHVVGDDLGVFVHGTARIVRGATEEASELAPHWRDVYGGTPEDWVDAPHDARYVEIVPNSMYTYAFDRERFDGIVAGGAVPDS
jgi:pyridoxamine 5'-phosphate oxidase-like protein